MSKNPTSKKLFEIMEAKKTNLCVALDVTSKVQLRREKRKEKKKGKKKGKKKQPVVRQPKGTSTVFTVNNSNTAKQSGVKTPPAPAIKIKKVADFAFGTINDIPTHLASHVTWTGEGTVQYEPPLNEVGPARSYRIAVTVAGAPVAPTPAELVFRVLPLDLQREL